MSQYYATSQTNSILENRVLLYGLDMPTGGYFYTEFSDYENDETTENVADGLTLSDLIHRLAKLGVVLERCRISDLVKDYSQSQYPSELQIRIGEMFGKNVVASLANVEIDLGHPANKWD